MDNATSAIGGIGLVTGSKGENQTTQGLGVISLSKECPLIFDAREAGAKINSNSGIFLTLDKSADASGANQSGEKPYINITNSDKGGSLEFGNFNKEIYFNISPNKIMLNCGADGIKSLTNYIKNLIDEAKPKPEPEENEGSEEEQEIKEV